MLKNSCLWKKVFGQKDYNPFLKKKHIGSLIHDFTLIDKIIFQNGRQFKDQNVKLDIWIGHFP